MTQKYYSKTLVGKKALQDHVVILYLIFPLYIHYVDHGCFNVANE